MQFYIGDILDAVRRDTHNVSWTDDVDNREGTTTNALLRWANWAQEHAQGKISKTYPIFFEAEEEIDIVGDQATYIVSDNVYLGSRIRLVEYSRSGSVRDYVRLKPFNPYNKLNSSGNPQCYHRQNGSIRVGPVPDVSAGTLRVTYERKLDRLDIRRGLVQGVTLAGGQLTALSIDIAEDNFDATALEAATHLCLCDSYGTVKMYNIPITSIDSTTGVVTLSAFTYAEGEDADAGDYVTVGKFTTTHSALVDDFERYISEYVARRMLYKDSSADAFDVGDEFRTLEAELVDSMKIPDKDVRELHQSDMDPILYGSTEDY